MYEFMTKIALTFSVFNLVIMCFLLTKMIDYRDKALAVYHVLRRHCAALVELDRFINGEVKDESKAIRLNPQDGKNLTAEELADILFYLEKLKNLQKRDKEKQKQRWRKLFNSIFAVFIAGLFFALGIAVWF